MMDEVLLWHRRLGGGISGSVQKWESNHELLIKNCHNKLTQFLFLIGNHCVCLLLSSINELRKRELFSILYSDSSSMCEWAVCWIKSAQKSFQESKICCWRYTNIRFKSSGLSSLVFFPTPITDGERVAKMSGKARVFWRELVFPPNHQQKLHNYENHLILTNPLTVPPPPRTSYFVTYTD